MHELAKAYMANGLDKEPYIFSSRYLYTYLLIGSYGSCHKIALMSIFYYILAVNVFDEKKKL